MRRLARSALIAHAALILASIVAFRLIVDQPVPAGFPPELWGAAYAVGMRVTGPLYILTGFVAALAGTLWLLGRRRGAAAAAAVVLLSLILELVGTSTGMPFGPYGYGDHLGPKVAGLVPVVIPLSWFLMLYASLGIALRTVRGRGATIVVAALGLVAWDVLMDPTMSAVFPFWSWHEGGVYYGMPLLNWAGWMLTGLVIAWAMVHIGGPALDPLAADRLPLVLYALNGLFPLALALQAGMVGAALAGGGVMLLYLASPLLTRRVPAVLTSPAP